MHQQPELGDHSGFGIHQANEPRLPIAMMDRQGRKADAGLHRCQEGRPVVAARSDLGAGRYCPEPSGRGKVGDLAIECDDEMLIEIVRPFGPPMAL
jgi:hypothetical protein